LLSRFPRRSTRLIDLAMGAWPSLAVCELELLSGLHFNVNQAKAT
jgi:hypothetical protein